MTSSLLSSLSYSATELATSLVAIGSLVAVLRKSVGPNNINRPIP